MIGENYLMRILVEIFFDDCYKIGVKLIKVTDALKLFYFPLEFLILGHL